MKKNELEICETIIIVVLFIISVTVNYPKNVEKRYSNEKVKTSNNYIPSYINYTKEQINAEIDNLTSSYLDLEGDLDDEIISSNNFKSQVSNLSNKSDANNMFLKTYPIGSIYISYSSTNPGTLFGGTWEAFGSGRTLVGINTGDTDFNTVGKTGGEKTHTLTVTEMPSHTHTFTGTAHRHEPSTTTESFIGVNDGVNVVYNSTARKWWSYNEGNYHWMYLQNNISGVGIGEYKNTNSVTVGGTNANTGGGGAHNNLQPYIVVYMWKRTA